MQCTPQPKVYQEGCKGQRCSHCSDSGYSGLFQSLTGADSCPSLSPVEFNETPKENLRLSVTPKDGTGEPVRFVGKDSGRVLHPSAVSWCETPKVYKRDASLRHRLLMCKPANGVKNENTRSPCTRRMENSVGSDHWLSASFDSLDIKTLGPAALKLDQDLPPCGRKRRFLFAQVRTSTLEDGKLNSSLCSSFEREVSLTEGDFRGSVSASDELNGFRDFLPVSFKESCQSPVSIGETNNLFDSSSILSTPSSTHSPKYIRSLCEDSGFSSLSLDKSQDSSVDHDGSFQELLLSASRGNGETPNLAETRRRSRVQRQHRLSTLKEGGSQSEEDPADRKHHHHPHHHHPSSQFPSLSKEEVFADADTPSSILSLKCGISTISDGLASAKQDYTTPLRTTTTQPENITAGWTDLTPLRTTPVDLSLTPALQLVHAMCQHKVQMFAGQSPSLKEQLKSTAALAEAPVTFRTTMPLAGLIGRKMGVGKVDILTELKKRNLRHILAVILSRLNSESVYRCGQVCKSWNHIIQQDTRASLRRRNHLSEVEAALELGGAVVHVSDAETRVSLLKRSALKTVQTQSRSSSYCTPQSGSSSSSRSHSGSSSSKRDKFLEVAKTLFNDECLRPCPRCQHPARCHSVKGEGVCSRADCSFKFCTSCLCAFHGSRECGSQSAGRRKKDILLPGSAQSKRNVRRL
ncbi:F-box only protein 43 [Embiotoca jacksoni]|uniref:F-box only protein 43 n=1 Tax=Embiotoca jacksoni TaxID=100190 RepID=UPI003704790F